MYTLEGVSSVANFITAYEESHLNRDSHFLSIVCSLFLKAILFTFISQNYISLKTERTKEKELKQN